MIVEVIKTVLICLLVLYSIAVTYIAYDQYQSRDQYMKDRAEYITEKTNELIAREQLVQNKEVCENDLKKLRETLKSLMTTLNSSAVLLT